MLTEDEENKWKADTDFKEQKVDEQQIELTDIVNVEKKNLNFEKQYTTDVRMKDAKKESFLVKKF